MNVVRTPISLRTPMMRAAVNEKAINEKFDIPFYSKATVACLMTVGSVGGAEAQQALPPVTVDAPVTRPRPLAAKPNAEQVRVRNAIRRQARQARPAPAAPVAAPGNADVRAADANPYANPNSPYYATHLASQKFSEPLVNTPRTVTVLTKEILEDKNATAFRDIVRSTAGLTLGTGEGGNAFGDRFFIRGFDARNDVFVDGVRDPSVSIRENFFTEQVEILRGPASSFAGRGTAGGAVNIVTKQAGDKNFYKADTTFGTDATKRVTLDVNQVINPALSVRINGLFQDADVAGRDHVFDDRRGAAVAATYKPTEWAKITANYIHVDLDSLPDFGVPYNRAALAPFPETGTSRNTWYGFVNRDFQHVTQDIGTLNGEFEVNDFLTVSNKFRAANSVLDYVGTLPQNPNIATGTLTAAPQSRYQETRVVADQTDATFKFTTGSWKHTAVFGTEFSREEVKRDNYTGLNSEAFGNIFTGNGALSVSLYYPPNLLPFSNAPRRSNNITTIPVDTKSGYLIETANYNDVLILNGGVRYDDYNVSSSSATGSNSVHSSFFNYNAGVVFKPLPIASIYAAFATSSNPVGAELDASSAAYGGLSATATNNQVFAPERNTAYEVGTKWELFDRRLLATAALFQTTKENAREQVGNAIFADGAYRVQGIDLGLGGKITDKWSVFAGLVLMDSKVLKAATASDVGLKFANIAHESFNVLTKYQVTSDWEIGGQATYASEIYGGTLAANTGNVLPAHWRFDAFTEYKVTQNLKLKFYVNNILDKTYYDGFYRSAVPFTLIAPGRSAYLVASAKF